MKCILCNDRNGSARCEGCQQLYCVPCLNKHREDLLQQFEQTINARNELNQSLTVVESTIKSDKNVPSIIKINDWERKTIDRIRDIAATARTSVHEILAKSVVEVRHRFDQLSADVQRWQKEGNYLEMDINTIKNRLKQVKKDIECGTKRVHIDTTTSENISWDTLIYVTIEDLSNEETFKRTQVNNYGKVGESKPVFSNARAESGETSTISTRPALVEPVVTGIHCIKLPTHLKYIVEQQSQKSIETPGIKTRSYYPSKSSVIFQQSEDKIRPCIVCKQFFHDQSSTGICFECNRHMKHPLTPSRYMPVVQAPQPNIYPTPHRPSDTITPFSSAPETNNTLKVFCEHCKNINTIRNTPNQRRHNCAVCQAAFSIPPY